MVMIKKLEGDSRDRGCGGSYGNSNGGEAGNVQGTDRSGKGILLESWAEIDLLRV